MNAPDKIYRQQTTGNLRLDSMYYECKPAKIRYDDKIIEYIRTDVFIEKAKKYLEEHFINEVSIISGGPVVIQFNQAFENFIKYMKGE